MLVVCPDQPKPSFHLFHVWQRGRLLRVVLGEICLGQCPPSRGRRVGWGIIRYTLRILHLVVRLLRLYILSYFYLITAFVLVFLCVALQVTGMMMMMMMIMGEVLPPQLTR